MISRRKTIGFKLAVLFLIAALLLCVVISGFSYISTWNAYSDFYSEKAQETARLGATFVDGDRIGDYLNGVEPDEYYETLRMRLSGLKREMDVMYLYIFAPEMDRFTYIMEAQLETDDPAYIAELGEVFEYTELEYEYLVPDILAAEASSQKVLARRDISGFGRAVEAWAPVFNSNGELVAMVEADLSLELVEDMIGDYMLISVLLYCGVSIMLMLALLLASRRMVARPLAQLTKNALDFASSASLSSFVNDIETGDEMQTLSEAFGKMAEDINTYIRNQAAVAADRERIATEMNLATEIQTSMLPRDFSFPGHDQFDLFALMEPAREVGGDFYDFFLIDETRLCIVVASVSGKGIPAALYSVVAKTMIKNQLMSGMPVEEAMTILNSRLYEARAGDMSVAAFVGVLDTQSGVMGYVNAGQQNPFLMRNGGSYDQINSQTTAPLAQNENVAYRRLELTLRIGDRLLLCTRGVTNVSANGLEFAESFKGLIGEPRARGARLDELLRMIRGGLTIFLDGAEREDDMTMLALEYKKSDKRAAEIRIKNDESGVRAAQAFLKGKLAENGLSGSFYAALAVSVEELMMLISARMSGEVSLFFAMLGNERVRLRLQYGSAPLNVLEGLTPSEADAVRFVRCKVDELSYTHDGTNSVVMTKKV